MDDTPTYLKPIGKPQGFLMKLVYYFTKKQLGKVITPIKILSAHLPISFVQLNNQMNKLDKKVSLPPSLIYLIRNQVACINVCEFCIDMSTYQILREHLGPQKIDALYEYETSGLFSSAEKIALNYISERSDIKVFKYTQWKTSKNTSMTGKYARSFFWFRASIFTI